MEPPRGAMLFKGSLDLQGPLGDLLVDVFGLYVPAKDQILGPIVIKETRFVPHFSAIEHAKREAADKDNDENK